MLKIRNRFSIYINLLQICLIDHSGSMLGEKIKLVRKTLK